MENKDMILAHVAKHKSNLKSSNTYFLENGKFSIDKSSLIKIKKIFELEPQDEILFLTFEKEFEKGGLFSSDRTWYWTSVFMENYFMIGRVEDTDGWLGGSDDKHIIHWKNIENTELFWDEENDTNYLRIFFKNSNEYEDILPHWFGIPEEKFEILTSIINKIADNFQDKEKEDWEKIMEVYGDEKFDETLELIEDYVLKYSNDYVVQWIKAECLKGKKLYQDAFKTINHALEKFENDYKNNLLDETLEDEDATLEDIDQLLEDNEIEISYQDATDLLRTKAEIQYYLSDYYQALQNLKLAQKHAVEHDDKKALSEDIDIAYKAFKENFFEQDYSKRKVIITDAKLHDLSTNAFKVLLKEELPDLQFPIGHPVEKELYVGHPYNNKIYIPISTLEEALFMDRFQEFSYFLQSLGATKISIENKRGKAVEQMDNIGAETNASAELGKAGISIASAETNRTASSNTDQSQNSYKHVSREQVFSPTKKPFLPKNLVWYHHEPSWQRLHEQRVNGNLLVHNEIISTEQHQAISQNEKRSLQQSLQYYVSNANVSHSIDTSHMFTEKETTEWVIHVEFAPINELTDNVSETKSNTENQLDISENEQKYIEEIKFSIEDDGQIDEDERRMLERKRQKYEISEERALELEKSLVPSNDLTTEELEYIEELKECATDGKISDGDRRILTRLANKLGISEERAEELENLAFKTGKEQVYTAEELKYIEEVKFCLEDDGEISASERRMLNKERDNLGISPERAEEIEQEFIKEVKK